MLALDLRVLNPDRLETLMQTLKKMDKDTIKAVYEAGIDPADARATPSLTVRYAAMMATFPDFEQRLKCWYSITDFDAGLCRVCDPIASVSRTIDTLDSCGLAHVMRGLVAAANALNSRCGKPALARGASGVRVRELHKVRDVKSVEGTTLLAFAVQRLRHRHPELFEQPFGPLRVQIARSVKVLEDPPDKNLEQLRVDMDCCKEEAQRADFGELQADDEEALGRGQAQFTEHCAKNECRLAEQEFRWDEVKDDLIRAGVYYGEDPAQFSKISEQIAWLKDLEALLKMIDESAS